MFTDLMSALYIILYIAPFSILRYYPFLDKLRVSLKSLYIIYSTILFIQIVTFNFLNKCNFWNLQFTQIFRLSFVIIYALLSVVIIKEKFFKHFFIYLMMFTYATLICGNAQILETYINDYYLETPIYLITNVTILLQLVLSYPLVFKFIKTKFNPLLEIDTDVWNYICMILMMFIAIGMLFGTDLSENTITSWKYFTARCIAIIVLFSSCVILIKIMEQTNQNATLNEKIRMSNKLIIAQSNHYKMLTDNINKAKAIRHDFHHHTLVLQSYLHSNQLDLLENYLNKYKTSFTENTAPMLCNNYVINAMIQHYLTIAESLMIKFTTLVDIPAKVSISDMDLCIILGNTIENAIEACSRMTNEDRFINLNIKIIGYMLIITIDNSYNGVLETTSSSIISSKREGSDEGIGLASVKSVASKYNGIVNFNFTKDIFKTSIMLNLT